LSYVSVWRKVKDRITNAALANPNEIIGLLVGKLENDTIIIDDTITGAFSGKSHRVVLLPQTIAKIADDIVKGRMKGNIVGWYHSHTEGGLFFSETDVATQKTLQQFSPLVVGMVVDAHTGDVGFFRIDDDSKPVRVSENKVAVFCNRSDNTRTSAISSQDKPQPVPVPRKSLKRLIVVTALIVLLAALSIGALIMHNPPVPSIHHTPITTAIVGSPIMISANSTGVRNMTLFYSAVNAPFTVVYMTSISSGQYQFTIPGSQVLDDLTYYLEATTDSGARITTNVFHIQISNFSLSTDASLIAYKNSTTPTMMNVNIVSTNGFDRTVTISVPDEPNGVNVTIIPNQGPPSTVFSASVMAGPDARLGTYPIIITATFTPPDSQQVVKTSAVTLTITDFSIETTPNTLSVTSGSETTFSVKVDIQHGWGESPVTLSFYGLPQGAKVQEVPVDGKLLMVGSGTVALVIQTAGVAKGSYSITVAATGLPSVGGVVVHSQIIQLTVR
jgi:proteasome lid subunit RPN8/RPN11